MLYGILKGPGALDDTRAVILIGLMALAVLLLYASATRNWGLIRIISPRRGAAMREMSEERSLVQAEDDFGDEPDMNGETDDESLDRSPEPTRRQATWRSLGWDPSAPRS